MAAPGFGSAAGLSSQARGMPPTSPRVPGTMCSVSVCGEGKTGDVPSRGQSSGLLPGRLSGSLRTQRAWGQRERSSGLSSPALPLTLSGWPPSHLGTFLSLFCSSVKWAAGCCIKRFSDRRGEPPAWDLAHKGLPIYKFAMECIWWLGVLRLFSFSFLHFGTLHATIAQ